MQCHVCPGSAFEDWRSVGYQNVAKSHGLMKREGQGTAAEECESTGFFMADVLQLY